MCLWRPTDLMSVARTLYPDFDQRFKINIKPTKSDMIRVMRRHTTRDTHVAVSGCLIDGPVPEISNKDRSPCCVSAFDRTGKVSQPEGS